MADQFAHHYQIRLLTGLKRTEWMVSAPQVKVLTGSDRSWLQTSTFAPAVANTSSRQWWSMPLRRDKHLQSLDSVAGEWCSAGMMSG